MKDWIPKKTILILVKSLTGLCVLVYLSSLLVVWLEIRKVENYYSSIESRSNQEERAGLIRLAAENNQENIQTLRNFFIQKGDEVQFIEEIERVARDSSLVFEIASIDVKKGEDSSQEEVVVKMDMEGRWSGLVQFIDRLEKMSFGVLIESFHFDSQSASKWSGSIEFAVFRQK